MKTLLGVVRLIIFLKRLSGRKQAVLSAAVMVAVFVVPTVVFSMREPNQSSLSSEETVAHVEETASTNVALKSSQQQSIESQAVKPAESSSKQPTEEKSNSQTANTGDKQHPTQGTSNQGPVTEQLLVSQSTFTIRAGETIQNAFTAKAPSGEAISPINIIQEESTPGTDSALSISHNDGTPTPLLMPTRHINLIASNTAVPGTYKVVIKATSDTYMNDNVTLYTATLTVTIRP